MFNENNTVKQKPLQKTKYNANAYITYQHKIMK